MKLSSHCIRVDNASKTSKTGEAVNLVFLDASQHLYNPLCMSVGWSGRSKFEIGNKVNNGQILS